MKVQLCTIAVCLLGINVDARTLHQAEPADSDSPWFCHGLDCPKYKVLNKTDAYEIRRYKPAAWVNTQTEALLYSVGLSTGFKRLFNYISGENKEDKKIAMTAPVWTHVIPGDGPFCKSFFTVGFFVPFKYQDSPPKPSSADLNIVHVPEITVAVSQFGGFLVDDFTLNSKVKALQEALDKDSISYNGSSFQSVGYDPPYRLQHRHNEIWLSILEEDKTESSQIVVS